VTCCKCSGTKVVGIARDTPRSTFGETPPAAISVEGSSVLTFLFLGAARFFDAGPEPSPFSAFPSVPSVSVFFLTAFLRGVALVALVTLPRPDVP